MFGEGNGSSGLTRELVERARGGDRRAFEELYQLCYPAVARRITHLVGPGGPVSDLVQDTFARAYQKLGSYRGEAPFLHWLLRMSTNLARSHYRKLKRRPWQLWDRPERESEVEARGTAIDRSYPQLVALHQALGGLSTRLHEAVVLYELEGLTLAEMAVALGIPLHTAASRLRRGREKLRRQLLKMGYQASSDPALPMSLCRGELR